MNIYVPELDRHQIGGGFSFLRNFKKGMKRFVHFVDTLEEADILFVAGVTLVEPSVINRAREMGKNIAFRVDNVPRKSRNERNTPHNRMKDYAALSDVVIYQSRWAEKYCEPLCGEGVVIQNGTDREIFYPAEVKPDHPRYLYAYHGKGNEQKGFWTAHIMFQNIYRADHTSEFWFIYDFGSEETGKYQKSNFDFWNGEKIQHLPVLSNAHDIANIMRQCTHFIYPAVADACPNIVNEAICCGLTVVGFPNHTLSGTSEVVDMLDEDRGLDRMCEEYYGVFRVMLNG